MQLITPNYPVPSDAENNFHALWQPSLSCKKLLPILVGASSKAYEGELLHLGLRRFGVFIGFVTQVGRAVGLCFGIGRGLDLAVPAAVVLDLLIVVWLLVEVNDLAMPAGLAIVLDCVVVVRAGAWAVRVTVAEVVTEV